MTRSQNGYIANSPVLIQTWTIPGTDRKVRLKRGAAGEVLTHFAAWFHTNIEPIDRGQLDDWGYAERNVRGSDTVVSNHASGTALDLNATKHPLGKRGTFTRDQAAAIRAQLKNYDGCIRWGGDYQNRPDEMHFEINKPLAEVSVVARQLRTEQADPMLSLLADLTAVAKKHGVTLLYAARVLIKEALLRATPGSRRHARIAAARLAVLGMDKPTK